MNKPSHSAADWSQWWWSALRRAVYS